MSVKLLTKHHLEFLSLKGAAQARLSIHLSKCHIVGNHMPRLNNLFRFGEQMLGFRICNHTPVLEMMTPR